jgi:hypothetical protein
LCGRACEGPASRPPLLFMSKVAKACRVMFERGGESL